MRSRVIPGSAVTIDRRLPIRRLKRVDFPTLGRPTTAIKWCASAGGIRLNFAFLLEDSTSNLSKGFTGFRCGKEIASLQRNETQGSQQMRPLRGPELSPVGS